MRVRMPSATRIQPDHVIIISFDFWSHRSINHLLVLSEPSWISIEQIMSLPKLKYAGTDCWDCCSHRDPRIGVSWAVKRVRRRRIQFFELNATRLPYVLFMIKWQMRPWMSSCGGSWGLRPYSRYWGRWRCARMFEHVDWRDLFQL